MSETYGNRYFNYILEGRKIITVVVVLAQVKIIKVIFRTSIYALKYY